MYLILLRWLLHFDMNRKSFDFDRHLFCFSPPDDETCGVIVNTRSVLYTVNSWMTKKETCIWHHILLVHPVGNPFRYMTIAPALMFCFFLPPTHTHLRFFDFNDDDLWIMLEFFNTYHFELKKKKQSVRAIITITLKWTAYLVAHHQWNTDRFYCFMTWPQEVPITWQTTQIRITVSVFESSWHMALWWNCFWTGKLQIRMLVWLSNELVNSQSSAGVF